MVKLEFYEIIYNIQISYINRFSIHYFSELLLTTPTRMLDASESLGSFLQKLTLLDFLSQHISSGSLSSAWFLKSASLLWPRLSRSSLGEAFIVGIVTRRLLSQGDYCDKVFFGKRLLLSQGGYWPHSCGHDREETPW